METRERILDATREVLSEQGLADTTLKAITDRAGVGAGSFYNLFASKEEAVLEVVRSAIEGVDPDPSGLGRERVVDLVDAFVSFFVAPQSRVAARIYLQLAVAGSLTDEAMARRVRRHHAARRARFAAALRREHPELDEAGAVERADRLLASLMGAALVWLLDDSASLRRHAEAILGDESAPPSVAVVDADRR